MNIINNKFDFNTPGFEFGDSINKCKKILESQISSNGSDSITTNSFYYVCHDFEAYLRFEDDKLQAIWFNLVNFNDDLNTLEQVTKERCTQLKNATKDLPYDIDINYLRDRYDNRDIHLIFYVSKRKK